MIELRPLSADDDELLASLQEQDDVWESLGALPADPSGDHLFVVMQDGEPVGIVGLVRSRAAGDADFEVLCAMRAEVQQSGLAKQACQRVIGRSSLQALLQPSMFTLFSSSHSSYSICRRPSPQNGPRTQPGAHPP